MCIYCENSEVSVRGYEESYPLFESVAEPQAYFADEL